MHPLINFAEEINKVLKSFQDITMSGKNPHTLATSEAGVMRLIRTACKAFHFHGSNHSEAEVIFSSHLENECGTVIHLPYYVVNRANIIFESAAATTWITWSDFQKVCQMPTNYFKLLLKMPLRKSIKLSNMPLVSYANQWLKPFGMTSKTAENILPLNDTLYKFGSAEIR